MFSSSAVCATVNLKSAATAIDLHITASGNVGSCKKLIMTHWHHLDARIQIHPLHSLQHSYGLILYSQRGIAFLAHSSSITLSASCLPISGMGYVAQRGEKIAIWQHSPQSLAIKFLDRVITRLPLTHESTKYI